MLFDGASLVLYVCGIVVYITNIVKGLRVVTGGRYGEEVVEGEGRFGGKMVGVGEGEEEGVGMMMIGREDGLKVLAASNTILALVLVGVLVLQAGQWYAERKEGQEVERMMRERGGRGGNGGGQRGGGAAKKKQ